jgi:hypothetical protein
VSDTAEPVGRPAPGSTPPMLKVLAGVLFVEAAAMAVITVLTVLEALTEPTASPGGGIALAVLAALAVVFLVVLAVGTMRGRSWVRGPAFTWQLLQLAVAAGAFQGAFARPDIGWLLLIPAVVGIALLFVPSVMNATRRPL